MLLFSVPGLLPLNGPPRAASGGDNIEDGADNRYPKRNVGLLLRAFLTPSSAPFGGGDGLEPNITVIVDSCHEYVSAGGVRSNSRRGGRRKAGQRSIVVPVALPEDLLR